MVITLPFDPSDPASAITGFREFWQSWTGGLFLAVMPWLVGASVYLKTRSITLSLIVLTIVSSVVYPMPYVAILWGLVLAWLAYRVFWKPRGD